MPLQAHLHPFYYRKEGGRRKEGGGRGIVNGNSGAHCGFSRGGGGSRGTTRCRVCCYHLTHRTSRQIAYYYHRAAGASQRARCRPCSNHSGSHSRAAKAPRDTTAFGRPRNEHPYKRYYYSWQRHEARP